MNERIKQLCEHAKVYATECTKHFTGDEPVVWMDYYTEKFAELIFRECIDLLEFHGFDDAIPYIKWMATNEFGVKE